MAKTNTISDQVSAIAQGTLLTYSAAGKYAGVSAAAIKSAVTNPKFQHIFEGQTSIYVDPIGRPPSGLVNKTAIDRWVKERDQVTSGRGNRRGGMRFYKVRVVDGRYDEFVKLLTDNGFDAPIAAHQNKKASKKEVAPMPAPQNIEVEGVANGAEVELIEA